jgi:hypothetical protein
MNLFREYEEVCADATTDKQAKYRAYQRMIYDLNTLHPNMMLLEPPADYYQDVDVSNSKIRSLFTSLVNTSFVHNSVFYIYDQRILELLNHILELGDPVIYQPGMMCQIRRKYTTVEEVYELTISGINEKILRLVIDRTCAIECQCIGSQHPNLCRMYLNARIHARTMPYIITITDRQLYKQCDKLWEFDRSITENTYEMVIGDNYLLKCFVAIMGG